MQRVDKLLIQVQKAYTCSGEHVALGFILSDIQNGTYKGKHKLEITFTDGKTTRKTTNDYDSVETALEALEAQANIHSGPQSIRTSYPKLIIPDNGR